MATNISQDDFQKTALRLPRALHAQLHAAAADAGRSYNAEIVARLQQTFAQDRADTLDRIEEHMKRFTEAQARMEKREEELTALLIAQAAAASRSTKKGS